MSTTIRTGGGCMSPAFTLAFQPAIFGNWFYGVTLLCVLLPLFFFLPVRAGALCSAALICGTKAAALGAGTAADLCFYRGECPPRSRGCTVQRRDELPSVFLACGAERGPCLCALLCCAAYAAAQGAVRSRRLFVQSGHRRRPSGSRAFGIFFCCCLRQCSAHGGVTSGSCPPLRRQSLAAVQCAGPRHAGAHSRLFRRRLCRGCYQKVLSLPRWSGSAGWMYRCSAC